MTKYAEGTKVSPEKSQVEAQQLLKRYGVTDVASGEQNGQAAIAFKKDGRQYRISFVYPDLKSFHFTGSRWRTSTQTQAAREQEIRRLWRALILVLKAKLEAVESGIMTFEEEFLSHMVTNQGQTVYEWIKPQLQKRGQLMLPSADEDKA